MVKRLEIQHVTRYQFGAAVTLGPHTLLLRPRDGHDLRIVASQLEVVPEATLGWRRDFYDNVLCVATFAAQATTELLVTSRVEVELYETMPLDFTVDAHALHFPPDYTPEERAALGPYLEPVYDDAPQFADWLASVGAVSEAVETFTVLDDMNRRIHEGFTYQVREEPGVLSPAETLRRGAGSCRDLAALFLESCRRLGVAARFVSGYVHGPATEAGGAATHAWAEVYLPGAGWKGFDPTNAAVVGPDHIPVAVHRQPEAIPPVAGSFTGPENLSSTLTVDVRLQPLTTA